MREAYDELGEVLLQRVSQGVQYLLSALVKLLYDRHYRSHTQSAHARQK